MERQMRSVILLLMTSLLTAIITIDAEAQLLNRLKKKAQEAAERKAEEKLAEQVQKAAEQMVEKSWNSIFGEIRPDSTGQLPFVMNSNVTTEDVYEFDTITTMEIQTTKQDGKQDPPAIIQMHFNQTEMYTGTAFSSEEMKQEDGELFIIYDFKNSAMLMLMANDKDKFSFAYDWTQVPEGVDDSIQVEQEELNREEMEPWQGYTKISSKTILGYSCDGYRSESEEEDIEIWITEEADFGMNSMFRAQTNAKQVKGIIPENYPRGMVMEMTAKDLDSGDITTVKVTDINKNADVRYTMSDYPKMSLGARSAEN